MLSLRKFLGLEPEVSPSVVFQGGYEGYEDYDSKTQYRKREHDPMLPDDIEVLDSQMVFTQGPNGINDQLQYLMYKVVLRDPFVERGDDHIYWKAVRLLRVNRFPWQIKENRKIMDIQDEIMASIWRNGVGYIHLIANILKPEPVGLLYCCGAQAIGETQEEAQHQVDLDYALLSGVLTGAYPQLEYSPLNRTEAHWLRHKMGEMKNVVLLRGIPKARKGDTGYSNESGATNEDNTPDAEEQVEEFVRGMSGREYVMMMLASPLDQKCIDRWLKVLGDQLSDWKSKTQGVKSMTAGLSMPIMLNSNAGSNMGHSDSAAQGHTVGATEGVAHTLSHSETAGHSDGVTAGENVGYSAGLSAGQSSGQSVSHTDGVSQSHTVGQSETVGHADSYSHTESISHSESVSQGQGHTVGQTVGTTQSQGESLSQSHSQSTSQSQGVSESQSVSQGQTVGTTDSTSHNVGFSHSNTEGHTVGQTNSQGEGFTVGQSQGQSNSIGGSTGHSVGTSQGTNAGSNQSSSNSDTTSTAVGSNDGLKVGAGLPGGVMNVGGSLGGSHTDTQGTSTSHTTGESQGENWGSNQSESWGSNHSQSNSQQHSESMSNTYGQSNSQSNSTGVSDGVSQGFGASQGVSHSQSQSESQGESHSSTLGESVSNGYTVGESYGSSLSHGASDSQSVTAGASQGVVVGESYGQSHTDSVAQSNSVSDMQGTSASDGHSLSEGQSFGQSMGQNEGMSRGTSSTDSYSQTNGQAVSQSQGQSVGDSITSSQGSSGGSSQGSAAAMSLGPFISATKSFQWFDENAKIVSDVLDHQRRRIYRAIKGGGAMYADMYIMVADEEGEAAARGLSRSAWFGEVLPTPVEVLSLAQEEKEHLLLHAQAFSVCIRRERRAGVMDDYRYSTVLLASEISAYTHPIRLEAGGPASNIENMPVLHVPTARQGEIYLGKILSGERWLPDVGFKTPFPWRFDHNEMNHTLIGGGTRVGKTEGALRFVAEAYRNVDFGVGADGKQRHYTIVALDWKDDWRKLKYVVPEEDFSFFSLGNRNLCPVRMNLMRVPEGVFADRWRDVLIETFCLGFSLGGRAKSILWQTLTDLYTKHNVFDQPENSAEIGLDDVHAMIFEKKLDMDSPRPKMGKVGNDVRDAYQRVLDRTVYFSSGRLKELFCYKGPNPFTIEELCRLNKVTVMEGAGLDAEQKKFAIGLIAAGIYESIKQNGGHDPGLLLILEEAHQVLHGSGESAGGGSGGSTGSPMNIGETVYEIMYNEGAGLGLFVVALSQAPNRLPEPVMTNSSIVMAYRMNVEKDINMIVKAIGKDYRYDDRPIAKWLPRQPIGTCIVRSGRVYDFKQAEPSLVATERMDVPKPTNESLMMDYTLQNRWT